MEEEDVFPRFKQELSEEQNARSPASSTATGSGWLRPSPPARASAVPGREFDAPSPAMRSCARQVRRRARNRGRRRRASPPPASGTRKRTTPLPPRLSARLARDLLGNRRIGEADRHLQPRALGEFAQGLQALDPDSRRFVAGAAVELDGEQAATAPAPQLRAPRRHRHQTRSRRTGPRSRSGSPSCSGGRAPKCASARLRQAPPWSRRSARPRGMLNVRELGEGPHLVRGEQMLLGVDRDAPRNRSRTHRARRPCAGPASMGVARQPDRRGFGRFRRTGRPGRSSRCSCALAAWARIVSAAAEHGRAVGIERIECARRRRGFRAAGG